MKKKVGAQIFPLEVYKGGHFSLTYKFLNFRFPLRECVKKNGFIWDFVPNIGPHPPTVHVWDKALKKRFFYNLWGLKAS